MTTLLLGKKDSVEIRELGGSMAPIWQKYFKNCDSIIVCWFLMQCSFIFNQQYQQFCYCCSIFNPAACAVTYVSWFIDTKLSYLSSCNAYGRTMR